MPARQPGLFCRMTGMAQPCASSRWCAAASAFAQVAVPRRVLAEEVAQERAAPRFVQRDPVLHPVAEPPRDDVGVLDERLSSQPRRPAAAILQHLGQIPVVEGDVRLDAGLQQAIRQPAVEVQPGLVDLAVAVRQDPRPRDGEAIGLQAEARASARCRRASGGSGRTRHRPWRRR